MNNCKIGKNVKIHPYTNLYGAKIGDNTQIGPFVEIQKNVTIGKSCKIQSHSFICEGVKVEDNCFIGHGVMFCNDKYPKSCNEKGEKLKDGEWKLETTLIKKGASIGSNATILCGIVVGKNALIGAGAVVTKNVKDNSIIKGNPAK